MDKNSLDFLIFEGLTIGEVQLCQKKSTSNSGIFWDPNKRGLIITKGRPVYSYAILYIQSEIVMAIQQGPDFSC